MDDAARIQQETIDHKVKDINRIVEGLNEIDPCTTPLVDALNGFFNDLEEEIPTEAILDENDIIKLIQEELNETDKNNEFEKEQ